MLRNPPKSTNYLSSLGNHPGAIIQANTTTSTLLNASNDAALVPIRPDRTVVVTGLKWSTGNASSGNYDIGIYTYDGTLLWARGSTAWPSTGTAVNETVPSIVLYPNVDYWLAFAGDNTTGNFRGVLTGSNQLPLLSGVSWSRRVASSFPLPATIVPGTTLMTRIPAIVVTEA